ncbi:MAG TPA: hypothetical protein VN931_00125, partial [Fibrobacteria bacterium]|nr:hypothetical protein [Fibrobacteria bacterium]
PLDAGTWVRKSLSVLPVATAPCVPASAEEMRREWKEEHPQKGKRKPKPPSEEELRRRASERDRLCKDVARRVESAGSEWTSLPDLHRFDRNPLPQELEERASKALEHGMPGLEKELPDLAAPLKDWLSQTSLDRAKTLESDYQKNSMVAEKAHEEDIVGAQTATVRNAAWLLAMRVENLRLVRRKGVWSIAGRRTLAVWHFDARTSRFRRSGRWDDAFDLETEDPSHASYAALGAGSFDSRLLGLEDFRFTAQMESSEGGLRPLALLRPHSIEDLRPNRRFVYKEEALESDSSTRMETVGYGYLETGNDQDTSWTLRHIGGRDPYDGLVVQEVPGNGWAAVGATYGPWSTGNGGNTLTPLEASQAGPAWGIEGGWRGNVPGDLPDQSYSVDLEGSCAPIKGNIVDQEVTFGPKPVRDFDLAWTAGASVGWLVRWPVRRLFLVAGARAGVRYLAIPLDATSASSTFDPAFFDANLVSAWQYHLDLVAGAQWSFSVGFGLGLQMGWEVLRNDPSWTANSHLGDFGVGAPSLGPGRFHFALQWVAG